MPMAIMYYEVTEQYQEIPVPGGVYGIQNHGNRSVDFGFVILRAGSFWETEQGWPLHTSLIARAIGGTVRIAISHPLPEPVVDREVEAKPVAPIVDRFERQDVL